MIATRTPTPSWSASRPIGGCRGFSAFLALIGTVGLICATAAGPAAAVDPQNAPPQAAPLVQSQVQPAAPVDPKIVSEKRIIGYSVKGKPIKALRYGPPDAVKVGVIIGVFHGTERAGAPIVKRLRQLGAPGTSAMWIVPTINPDGLAAKTRKNARGVDLNRNGTDRWKGTARAPDYYPGPSAASEPETRAYIRFLNQIDPDVVLIYHQHGSGVDRYGTHNLKLVKGLAAKMKLPVRNFDCDGECTGTLTGWFNKSHAGSAITIELPVTSSITEAKTRRWAKAARWAVLNS